MSEYGLYVHIPFCVRKCVYCDFYSIETVKGPIPSRLQTPLPDHVAFMDALQVEIGQLPEGFRPTTIFLGGGTPTELSMGDLQRLFDLLHDQVDLGGVQEWTCESNPGTLTREKAQLLRDGGVNRISMGAQSFQPSLLEFLGRIHGADDVYAGIEILRKAGFDDINIDLIYGVPGGSSAMLQDDVARALDLETDHLSCYCLTFEEGTPLQAMKARGYVREVDGEEERAQYQLIRDRLQSAGFHHYEISNFARRKRVCRHNLLYWGGGDYIGCGPSAHSHWAGRRYANVRSIRRYCAALEKGEAPIDFEETLTGEAKARELLVMHLRLLDGVDRHAFQQLSGYDYRELGGEALAQLCAIGMLTDSDDRLRLTEEGLFVSNGVFSELL